MITLLSPSFAGALLAGKPSPELADNLLLYGWLIGGWDVDVVLYDQGGGEQRLQGTIDAAWVIGGRAIQDVFAVPGLFHGTGLRFYDPFIDVWRVFWIDPVKSVFLRMTGHAIDGEIVHEGVETPELARAYGLPETPFAKVRWIFSDIAADSFRLRSERSAAAGPWQKQREYFARRR